MTGHPPETQNRPEDRPENRLAGEASPYLLQHARNPVDWFPWGDDALTKAPSKTSRSSCRSGMRPVTGAT